jgi:hypothetical protein
MRTITKEPEPHSLTEYRLGASYADYPDKDGLRNSLVSEQRGCAAIAYGVFDRYTAR